VKKNLGHKPTKVSECQSQTGEHTQKERSPSMSNRPDKSETVVYKTRQRSSA